MKKLLLACLCVGLFLFPGISQAKDNAPATVTPPTTTAPQEVKQESMIPVSFIVLDGTGEVTPAMRNDWRRMVKLVYYPPHYSFLTDEKGYIAANRILAESNVNTAHVTNEMLEQIANESGSQVVVLAIVTAMDQYLVHGGIWNFDGPETYVRTITDADLYAYRKSDNKMLRKLVREYNITDLGQDEKPEYTIKYAINKLVSKMENKEPV